MWSINLGCTMITALASSYVSARKSSEAYRWKAWKALHVGEWVMIIFVRFSASAEKPLLRMSERDEPLGKECSLIWKCFGVFWSVGFSQEKDRSINISQLMNFCTCYVKSLRCWGDKGLTNILQQASGWEGSWVLGAGVLVPTKQAALLPLQRSAPYFGC